MSAQGEPSVLEPSDPAAEIAADVDATLTPDSDTESPTGDPLSSEAELSDPGADDALADPDAETPADDPEPESDTPAEEAPAATTAQQERADFLAEIRKGLGGKSEDAPAASPKAEQAPAAEIASEFGQIDPDGLVKQFTDEFGEDAGKAIAPLAKTVKQLTDFVSRISEQTKAQEQQNAVFKVHRFLDGVARDGLETHIGDGTKTRLTDAQLSAREDLIDTARFLIQRDRAKTRTGNEPFMSDEAAVSRAAKLLFDVNLSKKDAVAEVRKSLTQRQAGRTVRARSTPPAAVAKHTPDTSSWDDDESARVKAELRKEGLLHDQ